MSDAQPTTATAAPTTSTTENEATTVAAATTSNATAAAQFGSARYLPYPSPYAVGYYPPGIPPSPATLGPYSIGVQTAFPYPGRSAMNSARLLIRSPSSRLPLPSLTSSFDRSNNTAKLTCEAMQRYLVERNHKTIVVLHSKVVQKSYSHNKSLFCPPPSVRLVGSGWKLDNSRGANGSAVAAAVAASASADPNDADLKPCGFIGITNRDQDMQPLNLENGYGAAKKLSISEGKYFNLHVKMSYSNGKDIGVFLSNKIKVVSKPAKRTPSPRNAEVRISYGSEVALFNRTDTRYLHLEGDVFHASRQQWGAFTIHLVDENERKGDGFVHYGQTVQLVCLKTGKALRPLVIRAVEKLTAILNADDPVTHLQEVAFYEKDSERMYLCREQDQINRFQATPCPGGPDEPAKEKINNGALWAITGIDRTEYTFCEGMGPVPTPVTPCPCATATSMIGTSGSEVTMMEIRGNNFTPDLKVWIGEAEAETWVGSTTSILFVLPPPVDNVAAPISLVRSDGIIYPTTLFHEYGGARTESGMPAVDSHPLLAGATVSPCDPPSLFGPTGLSEK